jgi:hypothetical protein
MAVPRIKIENTRGQVLDLSADPRYEPFLTGVGPVAATINHSKAATADGTVYNSSTVGARNLLLTVVLKRDVARARLNLYKYLSTKQPVRVYYQADGLDVCIDGYVETAEVDPWTMQETLQASIICPYPYWRDVAETHTDASHVTPLFEFPFAIGEEGVELSTKDAGTITRVENEGLVEAGITFEMRATIRTLQPRIYHMGTGVFMGFYVDLFPGERLIVTTGDGNKTITHVSADGVRSNYINTIMPGSTWLKLELGANEFSYTTDEGEMDLHIYHTNLYTGV